MRRQLLNEKPVLLAISIMALSGASAFVPRMQNSAVNLLPVRGDLTRRFVGSKWPLPLSNDTSATMIRATDLVDPSTILSSMLSTSQEARNKNSDEVVDLVNHLDDRVTKSNDSNLVPMAGVMVALLVVVASLSAVFPISPDPTGDMGRLLQDPTLALEQAIDLVANMGAAGPLYFGLLYTFAEVLAVPAAPLTAAAGYLFGVEMGTLVVLMSASVAASISFVIGRTLLRTTAERWMQDTPHFAKLDKAIGEEGFKLMLLLRLSPLFPFALSNYIYGATSIDFPSFFWATLLGFAPGTLAYVYTGVVGKALTVGGDSAQPWFVYAGGAVVLGGLLKLLVDVASNIVAGIEEDADREA